MVQDKHEDMDAYKLTAPHSNSNTTYSPFTGSSARRIHHLNIYNTSATDTVHVYITVSEATINETVTLRHVELLPEKHTRWASGLGVNDVLTVKVDNRNESGSVVIDLTWW